MQKIINHLKDNWVSHGFETFAVVIGVLAAFWLQGWREDKIERKNTIVQLTSARDHLIEDIEQLKNSVEESNDFVIRFSKALKVLKTLNDTDYNRNILDTAFLYKNRIGFIANHSSTFVNLLRDGNIRELNPALYHKFIEYGDEFNWSNGLMHRFYDEVHQAEYNFPSYFLKKVEVMGNLITLSINWQSIIEFTILLTVSCICMSNERLTIRMYLKQH